MGQVHRFRDAASIWSGAGPTCYMTADEARKVAAGLLRIAESIDRERFSQSPTLTVRFETSEEYPHGLAVDRDAPAAPVDNRDGACGLTECECDNTHEANDTVCRFCWSKGRRKWSDPELVEGLPAVPADWPVQPIEFMSDEYHAARADGALAQCGTCSRMWNDAESTSMTPAPAGRCPFENFH